MEHLLQWGRLSVEEAGGRPRRATGELWPASDWRDEERERVGALKGREAYVEHWWGRASATGSVAPREGRRKGNTLTPHKSFLIGPTNRKPEGSCACGCNLYRASCRAGGKWGTGLEGQWEIHHANDSELWLEIHSIQRRCPIEGGSVWRQNEGVRLVEGSGWGENWLCWVGWTW